MCSRIVSGRWLVPAATRRACTPVAALPARCFSSSARHPGLGFAFDVDGVLVRGPQPIPGAVDALRLLDAEDVPYVLLTNGGGSLEAHKTASISRTLDYEIDPNRVIVAHTPMRALAERYKDDLVLLCGRHRVREIADGYGFAKYITTDDLHSLHPTLYPDLPPKLDAPLSHWPADTPIAAVLVLMDPQHWERQLQLLCDVLRSDGHLHSHSDAQPVALYMAGPDFEYAAESPVSRFGSGAFHVVLNALFKELTGRKLQATFYGKPYRVTYEYAEKVMQREFGLEGGADTRIWGVGDNPETDIRGANEAGDHWRSALVRSGLWMSPGNHPTYPADLVHDDVLAAVTAVLSGETK